MRQPIVALAFLFSLSISWPLHAQPDAATVTADAVRVAQAAAEKAALDKAAADNARVAAEITAYKELSELVMKAAANEAAAAAGSVETMKWIFGIASGLLGGLGAIVAYVFGRRLEKLANDQDESLQAFTAKVKQIEADESAKLAKLAKILAAMMTVERILDDTKKHMQKKRAALQAVKGEADQTTQAWKEKHSKAKAEFDIAIAHARNDLKRLKQLDGDRREIVGPEPRWTAFLDAEEGLLLHHQGEYDLAYEALDRAIKATEGEDFSSRTRRASYLFNASCGKILLKKVDEAKKLLEACLTLEPRYYFDLKDDEEWATLATDPDVIKMRDKAAATYGPV